jgi:hypothetical protein
MSNRKATLSELPNDSWFDNYQLAATRAYLIHAQMHGDYHGAPLYWWGTVGADKYRALTTEVMRCDECETLCTLADVFEEMQGHSLETTNNN